MSARWIVLGAAFLAIAGCGSSGDQGDKITGAGSGTGGGLVFGTGGAAASAGVSNAGSNGASGTNGGGTNGGGASGGINGTSGAGPVNACGAHADSMGCVGTQYAGENLPLDIYVMFDQSCSMSCQANKTGPGLCCHEANPRIDDVRSALTQFLNDPASQGIGVGIGYFGYMPGGQTSCDPSAYSQPGVPIGTLPGNAQAVIDSVNSVQPTGETPTGAAIRGACTYGSLWQGQNPSHITVVLLVTDGFPEAPTTSQQGGCTPTIDDAVQAATTCSSLNLNVFVLGVGQQLVNLNDIAAAGGTKQAYLVGGANVSGQVLQALNSIRATAQIPCTLKIPPAPDGQTIKYDQVNITYCDGSQQSTTFLNVDTATGCDPTAGGWYYDNPSAPTQIQLCGASCTTVSAPGGSLLASVGCTTQRSIH